MNENQKERLLKIAETNPELAKEMMDFMKEERQSSHEPIAVKVVKAEEDKLTFTEDQKKWAIGYILAISAIVALIFGTVLITGPFGSGLSRSALNNIFWVVLTSCACLIFFSWMCAYRAGMPAIKQFMSKHFKLQM